MILVIDKIKEVKLKMFQRKSIAILMIILFIGTIVFPVTGSKNNFNLLKQENVVNDLDFNQNITAIMKQYHIPGLSACIIKNNEVVWSEGYGYYNRLLASGVS